MSVIEGQLPAQSCVLFIEACSNKSDQVLLGRLEFPTRALWDDLVPINREVFAKRFVLGEV